MNPSDLQARLLALIDHHRLARKGADWERGPVEVGVGALQWATGRRCEVNGELVYHPASTIKVALLAAIHAKAASGALSLDTPVAITNSFPSSMDGSLFSLSASDDEEKTLYGLIGRQTTIRELARLMIVRSSNLATNLLMEYASPQETTALTHALGQGAEDLLLRNRMMDMKAFEAKQTNRGTARGLCRLMETLGRGELAGSDEIIRVLLQQELNEGLPSGLPPGTPIAHKTGGITAHYHDVGIVRPGTKDAYAIAVLTRGFTLEPEAHRLVGALASEIDQAFTA
jgi:beta-lactamase class A